MFTREKKEKYTSHTSHTRGIHMRITYEYEYQNWINGVKVADWSVQVCATQYKKVFGGDVVKVLIEKILAPRSLDQLMDS